MLFKALFILLCFVVMFGCLDAVWLKKKKKSNDANHPAEQQPTTKTNQSTEGRLDDCTICLSAILDDSSLRKLDGRSLKKSDAPKLKKSDDRRLKKLANCGHNFHQGCINTWLVDHKSCPCCRKEIATADLPKNRTAPTNENEQQTTQHQHTITGGTQTFPQLPWQQNVPSSENGGWESYQHLLNDQRNNEHGQSYNGGPHYWDQYQNQMPSNVWEEQYLQENRQQNQRMFNDNYRPADLAIDGVTAVIGGIGRVVTMAGNAVNNYLNGTQDSEQMYTTQSVYDNPLYHDHHHMGTSYDNPIYDDGPSLTTGPYGQPAHGQGMHMRDPYGHMDTVHAPYCPQHHGPQHHAPYCPHHHPMN